MKVYIASGWFTPDQEAARLQILRACKAADIVVYSPKDDMLYGNTEHSSTEVFTENLIQIRKCDAMIASTVGKDMGTVFECGYAYSHKIPIIYFHRSIKPFNLMLAESAAYVAKSFIDLVSYLTTYKTFEVLPTIKYKGDIE